MLRYLESIACTSLRWIGALPKPLLVVGYASTFVLWLALAASTLQGWQQRQVVLAQQYAARTPNGALAGGPTSLGSADGIHPKTGRTVAAWLPTSFDTAQARASFDANKDVLDEVSPFWYEVRADGTAAARTWRTRQRAGRRRACGECIGDPNHP